MEAGAYGCCERASLHERSQRMNTTTYHGLIAQELGLPSAGIAAAISLFDEGNTIPFVARYRKEMTQALDEEQLRVVSERLQALRALDDRRKTILDTIAGQGKLIPDLERRILAATTLTALEDLYLPYKPKRRTRAGVAREHGLEPLAQLIVAQRATQQPAEELAEPYINDSVPTAADALAGARDIVAEMISDHAEIRGAVRDKAQQWAVLEVDKKPDAEDLKEVYQLYYEFSGRLDRLKPYQLLAINRGEKEGVLRVRLDVGERDWLLAVRRYFRPDRRSSLHEQLQQAIEDGAQRLLLPAIERDVRRTLTDHAHTHAIGVFSENLRGLLTQPPVAGHTILGIDPGFRTGCKIAVVDPTGKVCATETIYLHTGTRQKEAALRTLTELVSANGVTLIAIGNGTASRETESLIAAWIGAGGRELEHLRYLIVNEAGASVYSASPLARSELPELDVTLRGAVSIARRVQDPLAELVKIDPKSVGVGLYQHDVNQRALADALENVVESVVNWVGVDANTASPALLTHVAGIGPGLAERIVRYRDDAGPFPDRQALRAVPGLGPKAFQQAAGFLRINAGANPLDASAIHPESYEIAGRVLAQAGVSMADDATRRAQALGNLRNRMTIEEFAAQVGAGVPTLLDICDQLVRPGRDPRQDAPAPILRSDVLNMSDLRPGMRLTGTVRNVVDFGVFVDIGVKQDGLLHRSRLPKGSSLKVGDIIAVQILQVDAQRGRIGLDWAEQAAL